MNPGDINSIPRRSWRRLLILLLPTAAAAGWFCYNHLQARGTAAIAVAASKPLNRVQVHALGRLEPAGTILQLAPKSGNEGAIVDQLLVKEGDDVHAGAILAVLDNQARRLAALEEAKSRFEAAEARLRQTKAGAKAGDIEAQEAAVLLAEAHARVAAKDLKRAQGLREKQAISNEQIDQRQWDFDRLLLEERRARGLLAGLREVRNVDIAVGEKEISAAVAAVTRAEADASASVLCAPLDGRILKIHTHPGEKIGDRGVLEMGNVRQMQAVAEIFEADVAIIAMGMSAAIRVDSSDEELSGQVVEIGNLVSRKIVLTNDPVSDTDARVVEVRLDLDSKQMDSVSRLANARVEVTIFLNTNASPLIESTQVEPANIGENMFEHGATADSK